MSDGRARALGDLADAGLHRAQRRRQRRQLAQLGRVRARRAERDGAREERLDLLDGVEDRRARARRADLDDGACARRRDAEDRHRQDRVGEHAEDRVGRAPDEEVLELVRREEAELVGLVLLEGGEAGESAREAVRLVVLLLYAEEGNCRRGVNVSRGSLEKRARGRGRTLHAEEVRLGRRQHPVGRGTGASRRRRRRRRKVHARARDAALCRREVVSGRVVLDGSVRTFGEGVSGEHKAQPTARAGLTSCRRLPRSQRR